MAIKYDKLTELYSNSVRTITSDPERWKAFLRSACRNYKCSFDEQICIFAQKPDATAVLDIERWNKQFGRWVNRGTKGIAVFSVGSDDKQNIKYYFDISSTHESRLSTPVPIWEITPNQEAEVIERLEDTYGELDHKENLGYAVISAANNVVDDNFQDYYAELVDLSKDSSLSDRDDKEFLYRELLQNSVAYMLLSRCNINTESLFNSESFRSISTFDTNNTISILGTSVSDLSEIILREIGTVVLNQNIVKNNYNLTLDNVYNNVYNSLTSEMRKGDIENGTDISHGRGLSTPQSDTTEHGRTTDFREIRQNENEVPEGATQGTVHNSSDIGNTESTLLRNRATSERNDDNAYQTDGGSTGSNGAAESERSDEVGGIDEQHQTLGGGSSPERSDLQLDGYDKADSEELPAFLTENFIFGVVKHDLFLNHNKDETARFFRENKNYKERTAYVKSLYNDIIAEFEIDGHKVGYQALENGLLMFEGNYSSRIAESVFSWECINEFTASLIQHHKYFDENTLPSIFLVFLTFMIISENAYLIITYINMKLKFLKI